MWVYMNILKITQRIGDTILVYILTCKKSAVFTLTIRRYPSEYLYFSYTDWVRNSSHWC